MVIVIGAQKGWRADIPARSGMLGLRSVAITVNMHGQRRRLAGAVLDQAGHSQVDSRPFVSLQCGYKCDSLLGCVSQVCNTRGVSLYQPPTPVQIALQLMSCGPLY